MSEYKIQPSQILIVPGYTNDEILSMSAKTGDTSASAIKNATASEDKTKKNDDSLSETSSTDKTESENKSTTTTSSKDKKDTSVKNTAKTSTTKKTDKASNKEKTTSKVNESSAATATESTVKVDKPKALLFSPNSVHFTPRHPDYEEFNSADGLILIEKACDQFAELQITLSVHQAMRIQENGTIELSKDDNRPIDIITSGAPTLLDKETELGHFINPEEFTDSYIEIRRSFFDNFMNRPLTLVSDLFPTLPVCYIRDVDFDINEGEEQAEWNVTFKEVDNTWG